MQKEPRGQILNRSSEPSLLGLGVATNDTRKSHFMRRGLFVWMTLNSLGWHHHRALSHPANETTRHRFAVPPRLYALADTRPWRQAHINPTPTRQNSQHSSLGFSQCHHQDLWLSFKLNMKNVRFKKLATHSTERISSNIRKWNPHTDAALAYRKVSPWWAPLLWCSLVRPGCTTCWWSTQEPRRTKRRPAGCGWEDTSRGVWPRAQETTTSVALWYYVRRGEGGEVQKRKKHNFGH